MNIFYKYTKFFDIERLQDLHLRLSTPPILNDPFESLLNKDLEDALLSKISLDDLLGEINFYHTKTDEELLQLLIKRHLEIIGVVSLSETPRNLLMWAHYADEHKGICIGFDKNNIFDKSYKQDNKRISLTPIKVNYDDMRPRFEIDDKTPLNEGIDSYARTKSMLEQHIKKHLLTKSDEWIYEKEHRCIIPLECSDKIIFDDSILNDYQKKRIQLMIEKKEIQKNKDEYIGSIEHISHIAGMIGDSRFSNVKFMKKVNVDSIKSIHIGCRCDKKKEIIEAVMNENSPLKHVKLFECSPNPRRFELKMERIN